MAVKEPTLEFEKQLSLKHPGYLIAGLDEVGRGAIAGPVTMGAAIAPRNLFSVREPTFPKGVRDSKLLSEKKRNSLIEPIKEWVEGYGVAHSTNQIIDECGIMGGLYLAGWHAIVTAVNSLDYKPSGMVVIVDGLNNLLKWKHPAAQDYIPDFGFEIVVYPRVKADMECAVVSCASVLAKVERDGIMADLDATYPHYEWGKNKGYGSAGHLEAIKDYGPSDKHRVSYKIFK